MTLFCIFYHYISSGHTVPGAMHLDLPEVVGGASVLMITTQMTWFCIQSLIHSGPRHTWTWPRLWVRRSS
jgi:hypothetical protein